MGWDQLLSILKDIRAEAEADAASDPVDCPRDGVRLETGPDGQLFCPWDNWRPGDPE